MLEFGITSIAIFFVIIGICLIFIAAWIIKSESRINICKVEINKLRNQIGVLDREKLSLLEQLSALESAPGAAGKSAGSDRALKDALKKSESLEAENKKLKSELNEAKNSLEEFYKALSVKE